MGWKKLRKRKKWDVTENKMHNYSSWSLNLKTCHNFSYIHPVPFFWGVSLLLYLLKRRRRKLTIKRVITKTNNLQAQICTYTEYTLPNYTLLISEKQMWIINTAFNPNRSHRIFSIEKDKKMCYRFIQNKELVSNKQRVGN